MLKTLIDVREMQENDIGFIVKYWHESNPEFLTGMGVDLSKIPGKNDLEKMLQNQVNLPYPEKQSYALVWKIDEKPVGHCNVNKITFGEEAYMHLHLWQAINRKKGMGTQLVKKSLPYFFKNLQLKVLYCEPYALNEAPNKMLGKLGFEFEKEYITIPGSLNFEQPVKRWKLAGKRNWD